MNQQQENKNSVVALATSVSIHGLLLLAFLLLMSWKAPYPPAPEFGIELNFGLDDQGGGDIQPETNPGDGGTGEEAKKQEEEKQEEQVKEEEKKVADKEEDEPVVSKVESPVVIKEEKKEKKDTPKEATKEKADEKTEKIVKKDEVKKDGKVDTKVADGSSEEGKKGDNTTSHGDDKGKLGDKGNPEGKLDANALYGKPGGGGGGDGFGLSMSGWQWADNPKIPALPDNEDGRIEFEIECDEEGDIVRITTLQRGLSPRAEQLLKDEIRKNSLVKVSGGKAATRSIGRVVFILKTR